jgi:hypothetical protein
MVYRLSIMSASEPTLKHSTALLATWVISRILIVLNWILGALIFALLAISFQAEDGLGEHSASAGSPVTRAWLPGCAQSW